MFNTQENQRRIAEIINSFPPEQKSFAFELVKLAMTEALLDEYRTGEMEKLREELNTHQAPDFSKEVDQTMTVLSDLVKLATKEARHALN